MEKIRLSYTKRSAQGQGKGMIPVSLMYLCRLSILWKAGILFPGGNLLITEKSILPKIEKNNDNAIWIHNVTYCYREATGKEKDVIFELYKRVMKSYIAEIWGWDDGWQDDDFTARFSPSGIMLVYEGSKLVGYSQVENKNDQLFLRMMVVHSDHQRKGIGKKLLGMFVSSGEEKLINLGLEVFKLNHEAKNFYEKHGFTVIGETSASYVMRKLNTAGRKMKI